MEFTTKNCIFQHCLQVVVAAAVAAAVTAAAVAAAAQNKKITVYNLYLNS